MPSRKNPKSNMVTVNPAIDTESKERFEKQSGLYESVL